MKLPFPTTALLLLGLLVPHRAHAVIVGQIDDFESGTTQNWKNGGTQPLNITTGGPGGANDNYLQVTADGSGSGGKLTVFNRTQWLGNYLSPGVNEIDMDLKNFGTFTLSIRIAFKQTTSGASGGYLTTTPFSLPNDGAWHHAVFAVSAGAMTAIGTAPAFDTLLGGSGPAEFRIINESPLTSPLTLNGDVVTSQLGVDNILAVPEPGGILLLAGGFAVLLLWRPHRGRRTAPAG